MAIWLSRSRKIAHFLKPKIAYFLQPKIAPSEFSYKIYENHVNSSSFGTLSGENIRSPYVFLDNSATMSALNRQWRRTESTRAGEHEDENQGGKSQVVPLLVPRFPHDFYSFPKGSLLHGYYITKLLQPFLWLLHHLASPTRNRTPHAWFQSPPM
ncbi:uncharacterized protein LOC111365289 [Olea europaea var. sylvestris]|uniref:uncharacterized protein LOC111365289 n=1 Tax=Olea europaea var. sylvestris TaxID=158386 RepID=UPI000C1CF46F|nr:uncharacterized protein LOC111365289 [Olea europaea var. sylvestris]